MTDYSWFGWWLVASGLQLSRIDKSDYLTYVESKEEKK